MWVITCCIVFIPIAATMYWLGRGVRLNQGLRAIQAAKDAGDVDPDALIDLRTGEVIDPGTRKHAQAVKTKRVIFE